MALFGSVLSDDFRSDSDIDVLIDFVSTAKIGYFELAQIKRNLEAFTGRTVDLLTPPAISKFFRAEVLQQAECFILLGDNDKALRFLKKAKGKGHHDYRWSDTMIR
ncbi:hypothetical protein LCGC14_2082560, partial [marine sediment metagenome]